MKNKNAFKLKKISCSLLSTLLISPLYANKTEDHNTIVSPDTDSLESTQFNSDTSASMNTTNKHAKLKLATAPISNEIVSNAYNLKSMGGFNVDPRTGSLGVSFKVGSLWANALQGGQVGLSVEYTGANTFSAYPVAPGWSFSLPYVDMQTATFLLPGGGRYHMLPGNKLQYAKLQGTQFAFQQNKDGSYSFTDATGAVSSFNQQGYLVKTVNALGYATNYHYQGNQLISISDGDTDSKQNRSIKINYQSTQVTIESLAIDGKAQSVILSIQGRQLNAVTIPIDETEQVSTHIGYNNLGLVSDLQLPTGASFHVDYNAALKTLTGQSIPVVSRQMIVSNTQYPLWMTGNKTAIEPTQVIEYSYGTDGHNYLGYGSGARPSTKEDPMLVNVKDGYTYQSSQTINNGNGVSRTTTTTYDHFHRPIKVQSYANGQLNHSKL